MRQWRLREKSVERIPKRDREPHVFLQFRLDSLFLFSRFFSGFILGVGQMSVKRRFRQLSYEFDLHVLAVGVLS